MYESLKGRDKGGLWDIYEVYTYAEESWGESSRSLGVARVKLQQRKHVKVLCMTGCAGLARQEGQME